MITSVIILNWNGYDLLTDCVQSLLKADGEFFTVVADNASTDGSTEKFSAWLDERGVKYRVVDEGDENGVIVSAGELLLYKLRKNYGFAKGNNMALKLALQSAPERILLLNNDTEVEKDFMVRLHKFQQIHTEYKVLTPLIHYFYEKEKIWNAGGKLKFGGRRYYYANSTTDKIKESEFKKITFVTGCALYFSPELLDDDGKIFTERFFFGEEDFDFSLRMNEQGIEMACVLDSVIYHKVGSSIDKKSLPGKLYIHYLNRFIDIKLHYGKAFYRVWSSLYKPLIKRTLKKNGCPCWLRRNFITRLYSDAREKNSVTYNDFKTALNGGWSGVAGRPIRLFMLSDTSSDHTKRWVAATAAQGVEIFLFSFNDKDASFYEKLSGVTYYTFKIFSTLNDQRKNGAFEKLRYLKTISMLRRCINSFKPDILHAHYASSYALLGVLGGFRPFIISMWGSDVYLFPRVSPFHKAVLKYNFSKADRLLSTSNCMAGEAAKYTRNTIDVTPFGIDVNVFTPLPPKKEKDEFVVATVKRVAPVYGIDTLIEAFALVKKKMPLAKLRLIIAGDGKIPDAYVEQIKRDGIEDSVSFVGKIPNTDVPRLLADVDVFVALSRKESFGVAALEAMACEVPVVVSDADGFCEVVPDEKAGFIVPKDNATVAAEKILYLLQNREKAAEMGRLGRKYVMEHYSWDVSVEKMMNIYKGLLYG